MCKKHSYLLLFAGFIFAHCSPLGDRAVIEGGRIVANPLNLNYRFQFDEPSRREAADPVIEYFNGKYYLFASKSGGYWSSLDLSEWTYIPCKSIGTIEGYAPAILIHDEAMYYLGSGGNPKIYRTTDPDLDDWTETGNQFDRGVTDPAFFKDDDGKVYLYWGCSDADPIMGVRVDPDNGFREMGEAVVLITHNGDKYGWEVPGANNEEPRTGWNEGPCVIKHKGKYYLQYAAPGTQYRIYGDGTYVSEHPLGPYTYVESSPFSFKPGGFIGGAGHGHTFRDKHGNFWHTATMTISVRHMFERRIGLFPVYMSEDDEPHTHSVLTDYPFYIPDGKVDFGKNDHSMSWNLLSYGKMISTSSFLPGYEAANANDEQVETWWAAGSGNPDEWLQIDLGKPMTIHAIQVNFADHNFIVKAPETYCYQYYMDCSGDGAGWETFIDRSSDGRDMPHELIVLDAGRKARYIRIRNAAKVPGNFSLSDLRVFGHGRGTQPKKTPDLLVERDADDKRIIRLGWNRPNDATGCIIRWGVKRDRLGNAVMVYGDDAFEGRFFNRDSEYYFSVDAFNENGINKGTQVYGTSVSKN